MYTETFISPVPFSSKWPESVPWTQNSRYEQKMGEEGTRVTTEQTLTEKIRERKKPFGRVLLETFHDLSALYEYAENMTV